MQRVDEVLLHRCIAASHSRRRTADRARRASASSRPLDDQLGARQLVAPDSCSSLPHSVTRRRAPIRAPSASPRSPRSAADRGRARVVAQPLERQPVRRRRRLALRRVAGGDDRREERRRACAPSTISSISWRSAPEAMAIGTAAAACADELAPRRETAPSPACSISCSCAPLRATSVGDAAVAHRHAAIPRQRLEHADIVVAEVARVVVRRAVSVDAFLGERLLERPQVQRLAVGDDAVEVEDDRLQRAGSCAGRLLAGADRRPSAGSTAAGTGTRSVAL